MSHKTRVYILGPMIGISDYNFKAFDDAASYLLYQGYDVVSPTDLYRELGFDPVNLTEGYSDWHKSPPGFEHINWLANGIAAAMTCNCYYVLPGWESSYGDNAEKNALDAIKAEWLNPECHESICQEAQRVTMGARQDDYGHPLDNFTSISEFLTTAFKSKLKEGCVFTANDVPIIMVLTKLARHLCRPKRDNMVDIGGFANTDGMVNDERLRRSKLNGK